MHVNIGQVIVNVRMSGPLDKVKSILRDQVFQKYIMTKRANGPVYSLQQQQIATSIPAPILVCDV